MVAIDHRSDMSGWSYTDGPLVYAQRCHLRSPSSRKQSWVGFVTCKSVRGFPLTVKN
jgi:hypothetical protein